MIFIKMKNFFINVHSKLSGDRKSSPFAEYFVTLVFVTLLYMQNFIQYSFLKVNFMHTET
jgi:hypothetical protein